MKLKLKDNLDFKELEKYGAIFKYGVDTGKINEIWFVDKEKFGRNTYIKLLFKKTDVKKTKIRFYRGCDNIFRLEPPTTLANIGIAIELLYDLIKDGLVERYGNR